MVFAATLAPGSLPTSPSTAPLFGDSSLTANTCRQSLISPQLLHTNPTQLHPTHLSSQSQQTSRNRPPSSAGRFKPALMDVPWCKVRTFTGNSASTANVKSGDTNLNSAASSRPNTRRHNSMPVFDEAITATGTALSSPASSNWHAPFIQYPRKQHPGSQRPFIHPNPITAAAPHSIRKPAHRPKIAQSSETQVLTHRAQSEPIMPPPPTHTSSSPHIRHILNSYSHTPTHGSASPAAERGNSYSNPYNAISAPSPQHIPNQAASNPPECIGPYIVLKSLGSGAFSHVKLAVHSRDGRRVAIKMLEKPGISSSASSCSSSCSSSSSSSSSAGPTSALKTATTEADLIASLEHPNIIRLVEILDTPTHTCLVLEYASGGELYDLIADHPNLLTEDRVRPLFRDLCIAVKYLHDNHIAHRDLKVENVLLDSSNSVKLTDFGLAQKFDPNIPLTARCGSEEYAAPELIQALPYDGRKTDLWALGIILFALLTGELPFSPRPGERPRSLFHRICRGDFHFPDEGKAGSTTAPHVSDSAKDLVRRILKPNPARRATMEEVLAHPWLTT